MMAKKIDITAKTLHRQMQAIGGGIFEFGVKDEQSGDMTLRTWSARKALDSVRWLKYKNYRFHHIYLRPRGSTGVVLIDDLTVTQLGRMAADGIQPACEVLTSPFNYQAWVRVSAAEIDPRLATAIGEVLASRYDGDLNSKDWRHFGRAVGFTNIKPEHVMENGFYPFVKLVAVGKGVIPEANALLTEARDLLAEKDRQTEKRRVIDKGAENVGRAAASPEEYFNQAIETLVGKYGAKQIDWSRAEFAAVRRMRLAGYGRDDAEYVLYHNQYIAVRKRGHVDDYIRRTLDKVFEAEF